MGDLQANEMKQYLNNNEEENKEWGFKEEDWNTVLIYTSILHK
jgi:hypothetical protein